MCQLFKWDSDSSSAVFCASCQILSRFFVTLLEEKRMLFIIYSKMNSLRKSFSSLMLFHFLCEVIILCCVFCRIRLRFFDAFYFLFIFEYGILKNE